MPVLFKLLTLLAGLSVFGASAAPLSEDTDFGSNPGRLRMFLHVPDKLPEGAPLVVVAHGCAQTAQEVAEQSGWLALADRHKFALVFPQTSKDNEPLAGCFRTWLAEHQARGEGEPASVRQMVERMRVLHKVSRVFMTGMSSGGHLTNVMLATYPEVFAAGAPQASFPYKCAMAQGELFACATAAKKLSAKAWGELARSGHPGYSGPRPRLQIWHGTKDAWIFVANQQLQVQQWADVLGLPAEPQLSDEWQGQARRSYRDAAGATLLQTITIEGMGHAIAVDPGAGCGSTATYAADVKLCAAQGIANFFGIAN